MTVLGAEPEPRSSMEAFLADVDAHLNSPVAAFLKILVQDVSSHCATCHVPLPQRSQVDVSKLSSLSPFCNRSCQDLAQCICIILDGCLRSDVQQAVLLHMKGSLAVKTLNVMQMIADKSSEHQTRLRLLLLRLANESGQLPSSLFLTGARLDTANGSILSPGTIAGGFADVYRGRYNHGDVALKVLRMFQTSDKDEQDRLKKSFLHEALLWKNLRHRHVLPFLGVASNIFRGPCMVSPWMHHGNVRRKLERLEELVKEGKVTDIYRQGYLLQWLHEIALGLQYLHTEGIVHGDLRGANVLIDDGRHARLVDFGLAVLTEGGSRTQGSMRGGNVRWLAPELIALEDASPTSDRPTRAADIFAFGCLCVEFHTRRAPYQGLTDNQVIVAVPKGRRPDRSCVIDGQEVTIPSELWHVASQCWAQSHHERPDVSWVVESTEKLKIPDFWVAKSNRSGSFSRTVTPARNFSRDDMMEFS